MMDYVWTRLIIVRIIELFCSALLVAQPVAPEREREPKAYYVQLYINLNVSARHYGLVTSKLIHCI